MGCIVICELQNWIFAHIWQCHGLGLWLLNHIFLQIVNIAHISLFDWWKFPAAHLNGVLGPQLLFCSTQKHYACALHSGLKHKILRSHWPNFRTETRIWPNVLQCALAMAVKKTDIAPRSLSQQGDSNQFLLDAVTLRIWQRPTFTGWYALVTLGILIYASNNKYPNLNITLSGMAWFSRSIYGIL